jgi:hypothetical protein
MPKSVVGSAVTNDAPVPFGEIVIFPLAPEPIVVWPVVFPIVFVEEFNVTVPADIFPPELIAPDTPKPPALTTTAPVPDVVLAVADENVEIPEQPNVFVEDTADGMVIVPVVSAVFARKVKFPADVDDPACIGEIKLVPAKTVNATPTPPSTINAPVVDEVDVVWVVTLTDPVVRFALDPRNVKIPMVVVDPAIDNPVAAVVPPVIDIEVPLVENAGVVDVLIVNVPAMIVLLLGVRVSEPPVVDTVNVVPVTDPPTNIDPPTPTPPATINAPLVTFVLAVVGNILTDPVKSPDVPRNFKIPAVVELPEISRPDAAVDPPIIDIDVVPETTFSPNVILPVTPIPPVTINAPVDVELLAVAFVIVTTPPAEIVLGIVIVPVASVEFARNVKLPNVVAEPEIVAEISDPLIIPFVTVRLFPIPTPPETTNAPVLDDELAVAFVEEI